MYTSGQQITFSKANVAYYRPNWNIAEFDVKPFSSEHLCKHLKVFSAHRSTGSVSQQKLEKQGLFEDYSARTRTGTRI